MNDAAASALVTPVTHEHATDEGAAKRSFAVFAGGGALLGALAGVTIAIPIAAAGGLVLYVATAIDIAFGLALIGGLIGANIAGTD